MKKHKAENQRLAFKKLQHVVRGELVGLLKLNNYFFFILRYMKGYVLTFYFYINTMRHNLSVELINQFLNQIYILNVFIGCQSINKRDVCQISPLCFW